MEVRLLSHTQINPALTLADDLGDVAAMLKSQTGTAQERLAEFAARVCYRSTDKMGHNPTFVQARVREGHEDIIEHVTFVVLVSSVPGPQPSSQSSVISLRTEDRGLRTGEGTDLLEADGPVRWRLVNRHLEVTPWEGGWVVSGNARVWLDLFRRGLALDVLPLLRPLAPTIYAEFDTDQVADNREMRHGDGMA